MTIHRGALLFSPVYILSTGAHDGGWNMSFDSALFRLFRSGAFQNRFGRGAALWRFYAWEPAAVSLGYGQRPEEIDGRRCRERDIDIVRRPTGGRAVLHADEFTYSFFAETDGTNAAVYAMVHEVIRLALRSFGVQADFRRSTPDMRRRYASGESVSCFTTSARNELQVGGRKLVGSAQRRSDRIILQHGSLPLSGRHKLLAQVLGNRDPGILSSVAADFERRTVSLDELTSEPPSFEVLCRAMERAVEAYAGFRVCRLGERELAPLF